MGNGSAIPIKHIGSTTLPSLTHKPLLLKNVIHSPLISKNLVSISQLAVQNNVYVEFDWNYFSVKDKITRKKLLQGKIKDDLYQIESNDLSATAAPSQPQANVTHNTSKSEFVLDWHKKLGHPSKKNLFHVLKSCNFKINGNEKMDFCSTCQYGKNHRLSFKHSNSKASKPLELIHTDLWGPAPIHSKQGFKYYINFLDDFSRFNWIYPLKSKSESLPIFKQFKLLVKKQFNLPIKTIHSDSGREFIAFNSFLKEQGISHQFTFSHTSEQNGKVEKKT